MFVLWSHAEGFPKEGKCISLFCGWIGWVCGYKVKMNFCCIALSLRGGPERVQWEGILLWAVLGDTHGHSFCEERKEIWDKNTGRHMGSVKWPGWSTGDLRKKDGNIKDKEVWGQGRRHGWMYRSGQGGKKSLIACQCPPESTCCGRGTKQPRKYYGLMSANLCH